jgi:hypothetical protein
MPSETAVQTLVHQVEEGVWGRRIRVSLVVVATLGVAMVLLFMKFRGLSEPKAMEIAQIAREISRGKGWTTKMIRPITINEQVQRRGAFPADKIPDTYHAPLYPAVLAPFMLLARDHWILSARELMYPADRIIAGVGIMIFLGAVLMAYFAIRRLFDPRIAGLAAGFVLISETCWSQAMSGLPQPLLMLLFAAAIYFLARALEARVAGKGALGWIAAMTAMFGLLALTHAVTVWAFLGALVFILIYFPERWVAAPMAVGIFLVMYTPWLARNYFVSGNPFGTAPITLLQFILGEEHFLMRSSSLQLSGVNLASFRVKSITQLTNQAGRIFQFLGYSIPAAGFFFSVLHGFRRNETAAGKWALLLIWLFTTLGTALLGFQESALDPSNMHVLFVPFFCAYGIAFLLVLWSRLELPMPMLRIAFIVLLFLFSGFPLISRLTAPLNMRVQWPPYVPSMISVLNRWTTPEEIIASDMPWAVGWYADRRSVWLPLKPAIFAEMHDYNRLNGRLIGIYLTPITGHQPFTKEIIHGSYKDWAAFILRTPNLRGFPVEKMLPINDGELVFYADRERWTETAKAE